MKELTVVFPVYKDKKGFWVLMGKQAPGKRLVGIRNGYGGKCEDGEEVLDCAVREVKEEIDLDLEKEKLIYLGVEIENEKRIYFYAYMFEEKISLLDNNEFVDNKWFQVDSFDTYIHEMFPGNLPLMQAVSKNLNEFPNHAPFEVDFSGNEELTKISKKIYE